MNPQQKYYQLKLEQVAKRKQFWKEARECGVCLAQIAGFAAVLLGACFALLGAVVAATHANSIVISDERLERVEKRVRELEQAQLASELPMVLHLKPTTSPPEHSITIITNGWFWATNSGSLEITP